MGTFTKGKVVLIPFPFSDLSRAKLRPAIVLASAGRGDYILCQITSNPYGDLKAIQLNSEDFETGTLACTGKYEDRCRRSTKFSSPKLIQKNLPRQNLNAIDSTGMFPKVDEDVSFTFFLFLQCL